MKPWTRAEKLAWDAGFNAAESRISLRFDPHNDPTLRRRWAQGWKTAAFTRRAG